MLDIKTMLYLDAIHKYKNFTKASRELHMVLNVLLSAPMFYKVAS